MWGAIEGGGGVVAGDTSNGRDGWRGGRTLRPATQPQSDPSRTSLPCRVTPTSWVSKLRCSMVTSLLLVLREDGDLGHIFRPVPITFPSSVLPRATPSALSATGSKADTDLIAWLGPRPTPARGHPWAMTAVTSSRGGWAWPPGCPEPLVITVSRRPSAHPSPAH